MDVLVPRLAISCRTMNHFYQKNSADLANFDKVKKIGKSNCALFLRAILVNLEDKTELDENIEQLLKHTNLACHVLNKTRNLGPGLRRYRKTCLKYQYTT